MQQGMNNQKKIFKGIKCLILIGFGLMLVLTLIFLVPALWRNLISYPRFEKAVADFNKLCKEPGTVTAFNTYRGVMHVHSYLSHDSEGTLTDIIPAAKNAGIDFIFFTDHPRFDLDTFPHGYNGFYEDILVVPGSEKQGFDTWPLDSSVIDWKENKDTIVKNVVRKGGILFYAHSEEPHNWDNPYFQGMEIYNIHTDTKDETLAAHIVNFTINGRRYRHWAFREMFDEQKTILALWDSLNTNRKIIGFSAVDTHENQNFRARYLDDGRVEWLGPNAKPIDTVRISFWNRWLYSEPDPSGWIFKWMIDTYPSTFNHVTNYVLADTLTLESLTQNIKAGHLFTAFKSLGDAKGFQFRAENANGETSAVLGDSVQTLHLKTLYAVSPLPGQYRLIHNGRQIDVSGGEVYTYTWSGIVEKGTYRIEIHIKLNGNYIPWLYTNPIYVY